MSTGEFLRGLDPARFQDIERIGQGGFAEVFRAYDATFDSTVALKKLLDSNRNVRGVRERFRQEAQVARRIKHPAVLRVYDLIEDESTSIIVMEFAPGMNLWEKVRKDGKLSVAEAADIFAELADGLQAVHESNVIHRDIKPHNIIVMDDDQPKLTDFGIAHVVGASLVETSMNEVFGSPFYMAPEQRESAAMATTASDIYSLGLTLYYATTGAEPEAFADGKAPAPIQAIVDKCTKQEPSDRYESAGEVADALRALQKTGPSTLLVGVVAAFCVLMFALYLPKVLEFVRGEQEPIAAPVAAPVAQAPTAPPNKPAANAGPSGPTTAKEPPAPPAVPVPSEGAAPVQLEVPLGELKERAERLVRASQGGRNREETWKCLEVLDQMIRRDRKNGWALKARKELQAASRVKTLRLGARAQLIKALRVGEESGIQAALHRLAIVDSNETLSQLEN